MSAEEVLDVRGSLLHVTETEAILLQLLRQLSLHQHNKGMAFSSFLFFSTSTDFLLLKFALGFPFNLMTVNSRLPTGIRD